MGKRKYIQFLVSHAYPEFSLFSNTSLPRNGDALGKGGIVENSVLVLALPLICCATVGHCCLPEPPFCFWKMSPMPLPCLKSQGCYRRKENMTLSKRGQPDGLGVDPSSTV